MNYSPESNSTVEHISYVETVISNEGEVIHIDDVWMPQAQSWSPVYRSLTQPFSMDHFTSPRLPVDLGPFDTSEIANVPRILRMTIKPVGEDEIYLPREILPMKKMISEVLHYEKMINEKFTECEIHITFDYGEVKANNTQRFPGWHVDGLQGGKFKKKLMAEHSYIISTNNPTEFCLQPFFIKQYDEDITNFFKTFDQQAMESNIYQALPNHLYLMDAYMVHRTPVITEDTMRGFMRITVANAPLPIEFNTLNPMLGQEKPESKLDIRDWLRSPDIPVNYDYYGLKGKVVHHAQKSHEEIVNERKKNKQDVGVFDNKELTSGEIFEVQDRTFPKVQPHSPLYHDILEPFEPMKYTNPRLPIDLGVVDVEKIQKTPNVLRMPLKMWDSDEVFIPQEMLAIKAILKRIFEYDKCHNPLFTEQVAHITHDTRIVERGRTHRFPGFHGDDLQGGAFPEKKTVAHSYIVTTDPGTEVCLQPFFVAHIDDTHERHFTEFDKQAREENLYEVKPNHIYLVDPYYVHRTPLDAGEGLRTFLRITFSGKEMLLAHNIHNPMLLDRQEEYDALPMTHMEETLWTRASDKKLPYEHYGVQKKS